MLGLEKHMDHIEIPILVPEDRIDEFYAMYGRWVSTGASAAAEGGTASTEGAPARGDVAEEAVTVPANSRYLGLVPVLERHDEDEFAMSFEEFEEAIGSDLPASATRHRSWWSNSVRNSQARVWLASGWRVRDVDLESERIKFTRA